MQYTNDYAKVMQGLFRSECVKDYAMVSCKDMWDMIVFVGAVRTFGCFSDSSLHSDLPC
jgi:hypothetical protein